MKGDELSPTITTQCYGFGNGRFGHPDTKQNRAISLREAARLQTFPDGYKFVPPGDPHRSTVIGRLIGNAVPIELARVIARSIKTSSRNVCQQIQRIKTMPTLPFTVDAELLRELGERLVGKPHIALAELIKNSYDADATRVTVKFFPDENYIEVSDDGHGMTFDEFRDFWMRIGTTHKRTKQSKRLGTTTNRFKRRWSIGSSISREQAEQSEPFQRTDSDEWLKAKVDWKEAVKARELTEVTVEYEEHNPKQSDVHLFRMVLPIILSELKDKWDIDSVRKFGFRGLVASTPFWFCLILSGRFKRIAFRSIFNSTKQDYTEEFEKQMGAVKRNLDCSACWKER